MARTDTSDTNYTGVPTANFIKGGASGLNLGAGIDTDYELTLDFADLTYPVGEAGDDKSGFALSAAAFTADVFDYDATNTGITPRKLYAGLLRGTTNLGGPVTEVEGKAIWYGTLAFLLNDSQQALNKHKKF